MPSVTVIGAQWGDEGKGKIVDWLSEKADIIIRFQGGHNAGHTLVIDGVTYKLSLLPSGIVRPGKLSVIGNGVVLNPWALFEEIAQVRERGIEVSPKNLLISESACLILPSHWQVDQARELNLNNQKIGTTGRGIGPAYEDKVARRAIRVCDLFDTETLKDRLEKLPGIDTAGLYRDLLKVAEQIKPYTGQSWRVLQQAKNKRLLFEGAQGVMLDIDHGTYPFVTSSNTVAANAAIGSGYGGILSGDGHHVLGVTKAYVTRVGSGPFPTLESGPAGELMGERGREFGTVTGRKRLCGWLDAVCLRQAVQIAGIQSLVLTKIDVLDVFEQIPVCVGYNLDGERLDYFPAGQRAQASLEPIYEYLPGWQSATRGIRNWGDLPGAAKAYVEWLEELIEVPISVISTSPEREDTIKNPKADHVQWFLSASASSR